MKRRATEQWHRAALIAIVILFVAGSDFFGWNILNSAQPAGDSAFRLGRFSIAVLAFDNLSGDPLQDYLSDGTSENIITDLSRLKNLAVVARHSSFAFKGKAMDVKAVARELGARYVVRGGVQRSGEHVRIDAQLIDALDGRPIWARRYDRRLQELFAVQHQIARALAAAIPEMIIEAGWEEPAEKPPAQIEAWDWFFRGREIMRGPNPTPAGLERASSYHAKALELSPDYPAAVRGLGWVAYRQAGMGGGADAVNTALGHARRAEKLDPHNDQTYWLLGAIFYAAGLHETAVAAFERAREINPNYADGLLYFARTLIFTGRLDEAFELAEKASRLNPIRPHFYTTPLGIVYYFSGHHRKTIALLEHLDEPLGIHLRHLAASHVKLGNMDAARKAAGEVLNLQPNFSLKRFSVAASRIITDEAQREEYISALRKAGLPE